MSYVCEVCGGVVPAGVQRKVHRTYRKVPHVDQRGRACHRCEIASEAPVCEACDSALWAGQTVQERSRYFTDPVKLVIVHVKTRCEEDHRPRCDVCGEVVVDGQVTAESTLCSKHLKSILQRKRRGSK